ncbi:Crp/Fnr family transcriptional regulator [Saccharicrinis sp. 156]|uniref:Crp/Fnr family transcriptional regulator n=1 Tax=Saccharicrinis sp. 156 TaxID=3417574 RepID=UPI003D34BB47
MLGSVSNNLSWYPRKMELNALLKILFEPKLLQEIGGLGKISIPKNTIILTENMYIKEIPLVLDGDIKVRKTDENGKELVLYHIEKGESCVLSITSCLNKKKSTVEAIAQKDTRIVKIPVEKVERWMDEYKSWKHFVFKMYYDRLDSILTLVNSIMFKQTDNRLYDKLRELQAKNGNLLRFTHQELASEIGTAREVISRLLKLMEKDGLIELDRGEIKLLQSL